MRNPIKTLSFLWLLVLGLWAVLASGCAGTASDFIQVRQADPVPAYTAHYDALYQRRGAVGPNRQYYIESIEKPGTFVPVGSPGG